MDFLCALSNGDGILTSMNEDRGEFVHETPAADDIRDSRLVHRNEAPGELAENEERLSPFSPPAMKTSAHTAALYATLAGTLHPSANFAKNSARPRSCHFVLVRQEAMPKLLR